MNDQHHNDPNAEDSEFDRERALISSAYKNAAPDLPPPAMDDAIRAAAHRAVKSQPHLTSKSWVARWSAPLSAAALVVLAVSVGLNVNDAPQQSAPSAGLGEALAPDAKPIDSPVIPPAPTVATNAMQAESPALAAAAPVSARRPAEKKSSVQPQNAAPRDQLAQSPMVRERYEVGSASAGKIVSDSRQDAVAPERSPAVAAPSPASPATSIATARETKAFVADPAADVATQRARTAVAAGAAKSEATKDKQGAASMAVVGRAVRSAERSDAPTVAQSGAPAIAALALEDKAIESAETWMKRILELKRQEKTREFNDELAKFRKRYPDFALPEELKAGK